MLKIISPNRGKASHISLPKASEQFIVMRVRNEVPGQKYIIYDCLSFENPSRANTCVSLTSTAGELPFTTKDAESAGERDNVFKVKLLQMENNNNNNNNNGRKIFIGKNIEVNPTSNNNPEWISFVYRVTETFSPVTPETYGEHTTIVQKLLMTTDFNPTQFFEEKDYSLLKLLNGESTTAWLSSRIIAKTVGTSDSNIKILSIYPDGKGQNCDHHHKNICESANCKWDSSVPANGAIPWCTPSRYYSIIEYESYMAACTTCENTHILESRMKSFTLYKSVEMFITGLVRNNNNDNNINGYGITSQNISITMYDITLHGTYRPLVNSGNGSLNLNVNEMEALIFFATVLCCMCTCCFCCIRRCCNKRRKLKLAKEKNEMIYRVSSQSNIINDDEEKEGKIQVVDEHNLHEMIDDLEPIDKEFYRSENFIGGKILRIVTV